MKKTYKKINPSSVLFQELEMYCYTVRCQFTGNSQSADHWLAWLRDIHIDEVIEAGARSADIVKMQNETLTYEIRYLFDSLEAFETYEREHAPRLRKEGLELFPLDQGLEYDRTCGETIFSVPDRRRSEARPVRRS